VLPQTLPQLAQLLGSFWGTHVPPQLLYEALQGALQVPFAHFGVALGSVVEQTWHVAPHLAGSVSAAHVVLLSQEW
jgi:hypothetical protein